MKWSRTKKRIVGLAAAVGVFMGCALFAPRPGAAATVGADEGPTAVEVHGFASQGFILTRGNDYLVDHSTHGSFQYSEFGINFTTNLSDSLRTGGQLFAQDLGPKGNYDVKVDWFYVDYRWKNWLGLRAGRLKIPYGLHNEIQDVDAARVPVLLPQSVYPLQTRDILFAQTGAELYGFLRSDALGALDYRLFAGTIFLDSRSLTPIGTPFELDFRVPYVLGGRVLWETPLEGLRVGASIEDVKLDTTVLIPGMAPFEIRNHSVLWVGSAELSVGDLVLTTEYSRWISKQASDIPAISPPVEETNERGYAMASYRLTPWFQPAAYYSVFFPDVEHRRGRENRQVDVAGTLRFDINPYWLVKLEAHYMAGTAGLVNPLRINPQDITQADRYWAAFFLKTTAHF